jgi:hypothetical protein
VTVRSSKPKAATMACTGQPWASNVTTTAITKQLGLCIR